MAVIRRARNTDPKSRSKMTHRVCLTASYWMDGYRKEVRPEFAYILEVYEIRIGWQRMVLIWQTQIKFRTCGNRRANFSNISISSEMSLF
jgi:hypothetical protein